MTTDVYGPGDDDYGRDKWDSENTKKEIINQLNKFKMVRAKFIVNSNKDNGYTDENYKGSEIHLSAVYSGSPENEAFFKMTPGGNISLVTVNPKAAEQFIQGKEFYVDFTPVE